MSIYDAADQLIESGLASQSANSVDWFYDTTTLNSNLADSKITAEAKESPSNTTLETLAII